MISDHQNRYKAEKKNNQTEHDRYYKSKIVYNMIINGIFLIVRKQ